MNQTVLRIMRYEIITNLTRPAYLILAFGVPLLALLVVTGLDLLRGSGAESDAEAAQDDGYWYEGYVDQSGLIKQLPPDLPAGVLRYFPDEASARQALEADEIDAYSVIPADYLEQGVLNYVLEEYSPLSDIGWQDWMIRWVLLYNLAGGDPLLAGRAWDPLPKPETTNLSQQAGEETSGGLAEGCEMPGMDCETNFVLSILPLGVLIVFFITIMSSGGLIMTNITKEKENRVMEVLLVSISPRQLLVGKLLGGAVLGLVQTTSWLAMMSYSLNQGRMVLELPPGYQFPPSFVAWGLVFFSLGYAIYASLMAAAGALVPNIKSYSSASILVASPLFAGYMLSAMLGSSPHGLLMTVVSIFPLSAPVSMVWRLAHGGVPDWQPPLAAGLALLTALLIVPAAARAFRAQALLSGEPFKAGKFLRVLLRG